MKCIIIDDEATARTILVQLCKQLPNLQVENTFSDALTAIKYLNQHSIDLIFLDLHIPVFSGFDFIATLSHHHKIILTTSDPSFALEAFEHNHIAGYIVKPLKYEDYVQTIARILNYWSINEIVH